MQNNASTIRCQNAGKVPKYATECTDTDCQYARANIRSKFILEIRSKEIERRTQSINVYKYQNYTHRRNETTHYTIALSVVITVAVVACT